MGRGGQIRDLHDETCDGDQGLPKRRIGYEELERIWVDTSVKPAPKDSINFPEKQVLRGDEGGPGVIYRRKTSFLPKSDGLCGTSSDDLSLGTISPCVTGPTSSAETGNEVSVSVNSHVIEQQNNKQGENENTHVRRSCNPFNWANITCRAIKNRIIVGYRKCLKLRLHIFK